MPPKPKNTKEEIAVAAFAIIKQKGIDALTARELGHRLESSAGSIFTQYQSMDEVKLAARELALAEFKVYISDYRAYNPQFQRIGMMIVNYGRHEPELFKLLFMQKSNAVRDISESIKELGDIYDNCTLIIQRDYGLTKEDSRYLFEQLWITAFGLGVMCALGAHMSEQEVSTRLSTGFMSMLMFMKSNKQ